VQRNNDGLHFSVPLISDVVNSRWSLLDVIEYGQMPTLRIQITPRLLVRLLATSNEPPTSASLKPCTTGIILECGLWSGIKLAIMV